MTATVEKTAHFEFSKAPSNQILQGRLSDAVHGYKTILRAYLLFNVLFGLILLAEIFYFIFSITIFIQTFVVAINLALIVATLFSYFTLRLVFQTNKISKSMALIHQFENACKAEAGLAENTPEYHVALAHAYCKLATALHVTEYSVLPTPRLLYWMAPSIEKFSCLLFWRDVSFMKETLLQLAAGEHIKIIRIRPTDLEAHVGLANAYVMLSGLYVDPRTVEGLDDDRWIPSSKYGNEFKKKFRITANKAIEEFKILSDYAPDDPWVHAQLAYSYRDLQMREDEIREYETILRLCPNDKETLFKLGKLYFEQGLNAKGLKIYESLKNSHYKKAESLIHFYGSKNEKEIHAPMA